MLKSILTNNDVSWYCDTFGVMHRYPCTLYRPISSVCACVHAHVYVCVHDVCMWASIAMCLGLCMQLCVYVYACMHMCVCHV